MKLLSIGNDRNIFDEKSAVRLRQIGYGAFCEELHLIVFTKKTFQKKQELKISEKVFLHPTASVSRFFYVFDAIRIGSEIVKKYRLERKDSLITCQDPFEAGFVGWMIAKNFNLKLHLQVHTDFLSPYFVKDSFLNTLRVLLAKFVLKKASGIRVVSEKIKSSIEKELTIQQSKIEVLPIYVDAEMIQNHIPQTDLHKKYPQFEKTVLMMSRLEQEKNIPLSLGVFAEVVKKFPKTGLIIVGSGSKLTSLVESVLKNNLKQNVVFESWSADPLSYLKTADLFLLTSDYEGYGLTLVEAALSNCPIISTDVGIASQLSLLGKCSVFPVGDAKSLQEKVEEFLQNDRKDFTIEKKLEGLVYDKADYAKRFEENLRRALG